MTIFLKPEQEQFIQTQIETGKYVNAEEVVNEAFQLLKKRDRALDELRQKIAVGTKQITSGQVTDGEIVFSRFQQKIQEMIESGLWVATLQIADRGYVLEAGRITLKGKAKGLLNDERVKKAYLG